ncbi:MAG: hypothetical protein V4629_03140 [Pseudomonadota bacterium]
MIKSTNYWESFQALNGWVYLSWGGGCARLLIPKVSYKYLIKMRTVKNIVITKGSFKDKLNCFEIMFEDGSESPFSIIIQPEQTDKLSWDDKGKFPFTVWTEQGMFKKFWGWYRTAVKLPYLMPLKNI